MILKMPFGMVNSAATLVRAMRKLLAGLENVDSYIDDILIHTRTWEEHIQALRELFSRMLKWGYHCKTFEMCLWRRKS